MNDIKYLSLFSGIGGFELGIQQAYEIYRNLNVQKKRGGEKTSQRELQKNGERLYAVSSKRTLFSNDWDNELSNRSIDERQPNCIGFSEIDKYAIQIYEKHFKHKNYGDITTIQTEELPNFDLLVGGFPCQSFSIAGKRKGFDDTRGTLFFDIARILADKKPRHLVLENVKGLLSHDGGKTFTTIIGVLTDLGYLVEWQVLNSKNFGVPQNRERVFIIGHLGRESRPEVFPIRGADKEANEPSRIQSLTNEREISRTLLARDYKDPKLVKVADYRNDEGLRIRKHSSTDISTMPPFILPVLTPNRLKKRQNGRRFKEDGEPSFTLTGQDRHGVAIMRGRPKYKDGKRGLKWYEYKKTCPAVTTNVASGDQKNIVMPQIRRLTPTECERLQGFPDGWTEGISDTQRYKCLGNAVTTNVIKAIMERLL